jgi:DNA polymerase-3 subunit delta'
MSFNNIINQEIAKKVLKSAIKEDKISNSYLFFGPEGSGKKLAALEFAKVLNCPKANDGEACDNCSSCRRIEENIHPDVSRLAPSGAKQVISINAVRELEKTAQLKSFEAKYKVFIVERADRFTKEAGNSFLKTLEEPPSNVVIILLSALPDKILPTIISRCQKIKFVSLSPSEGIEVVKKRFDIEQEQAHTLYFVCSGKMKFMELWMELDLWDLREKIFKFLGKVSSQKGKNYDDPLSLADLTVEKISTFADELKKEKQKEVKGLSQDLSSAQLKDIDALKKAEVEDLKKDMIKVVLSVIKSFFTDIFALSRHTEFIANTDKQDLLAKQVKNFSDSYLLQAIEEVERDDNFLDSGANLALTFQVLFINLFCNSDKILSRVNTVRKFF